MPLKTEAGRDRWAKMTEEQRRAANKRRQAWRRRRQKALPPVSKREHVLVELYCRPTRQRFFGITCDSLAAYWSACQRRASSKPRRHRLRHSILLQTIAKHGAESFRLRKLETFDSQEEARREQRRRYLEQHFKRLLRD